MRYSSCHAGAYAFLALEYDNRAYHDLRIFASAAAIALHDKDFEVGCSAVVKRWVLRSVSAG